MSLPYRQRYRLRSLRRALADDEPRLASMHAMFARLYAQDAIPVREQLRRRLPRPVRVLLRAVWALLCVAGRVLRACARLLRPCARPLRPFGRLLRRAALRCLISWRFLPAGFRLTAGAWLVAHRAPASIPPTAHR